MNLRFIDWIWHVRGSLALAPGQSGDDAFERLSPLFYETGTKREQTRDSLLFTKKDPGAQDKMSIFDSGALTIERDVAGPVLRYHLISRALLACFLAPLLFFGIAQLTIAIGKLEKAPAAAAPANPAKEPKKTGNKYENVPMSPIDKWLGAPTPEKPKKEEATDSEGQKKKPSPTPAYVFMGIFAVLYVVGRILEDRLIKSLFRKRLLGL